MRLPRKAGRCRFKSDRVPQFVGLGVRVAERAVGIREVVGANPIEPSASVRRATRRLVSGECRFDSDSRLRLWWLWPRGEAPDCGSGRRGFKSRQSPHTCAGEAVVLVRSPKPRPAGSTPAIGANVSRGRGIAAVPQASNLQTRVRLPSLAPVRSLLGNEGAGLRTRPGQFESVREHHVERA